MFNKGLKNDAIKNLEKSIVKYDIQAERVQIRSADLYNLRSNSGYETIEPVEKYVNTLANTPKEFDRSFTEYKTEFKTFEKLINDFQNQSINTDLKAGGGAAAGIGAGVGTAALMPAAAMAIATTFGTASTGTAIAGLSGAAATNAALAWLGGGALAAGGGGMAAGTAFLALAGPIGLGIGAVGLIGSGLFASSNNKKIAEKANKQRAEVETRRRILEAAAIEINSLIKLTKKHNLGVKKMLKELSNSAPYDYMDFTESHKEMLAALINHIRSLSKLLNKKVD
jgi:hypothetical protein